MQLRKALLLGDITNKIKDRSRKKFLEECIERFPSYFWIAPSSGSGKYHPSDEHGDGGLFLHTRRVVKVCEHLSVMENLNERDRDILIIAAVLHDSFAKGRKGSYSHSSDKYHPLYPVEYFPYSGFGEKYLQEEEYDDIMEAVVSHMGRFSVTKSLVSKEKIPYLLQVADYLTSRKDIIVTL